MSVERISFEHQVVETPRHIQDLLMQLQVAKNNADHDLYLATIDEADARRARRHGHVREAKRLATRALMLRKSSRRWDKEARRIRGELLKRRVSHLI